MRLVPGILGSDSKGGYDSIMVNESPMLGLSNTRSAIQAFQLKESIPRCLTNLLWLASDWNLAELHDKEETGMSQIHGVLFSKASLDAEV